MKTTYQKIFSLLICFVFLASCQSVEKTRSLTEKQLHIAPSSTPFIIKSNKESSIETNIQHFLDDNNVNGSVFVGKHGRILFNKGVGFADVLNKDPNTASTTFGIGSITKTFVATSILQLQEKGKLHINDPVKKYIPNFPNGSQIKLVNLLSHTSGIQRPKWRNFHYNHKQLVDTIKRRPVKFRAGSKWDYEDVNYMVLGYIIEKITKMPLHEYIQKNIFAAAQIKDAGFIPPNHLDGVRSTGYIQTWDKLVPIKHMNTSTLFACGDIYTSAKDLFLYDQALLTGKLLSRKSLEEVLTPRSPSHYGLGLYINGNTFSSHGVLGGWDTLHVYNKNNRTSIVILLNVRKQRDNIRDLARGINDIIHTPKKMTYAG